MDLTKQEFDLQLYISSPASRTENMLEPSISDKLAFLGSASSLEDGNYELSETYSDEVASLLTESGTTPSKFGEVTCH